MPVTATLRAGGLRYTVTADTDQGLRYPGNFDVLHVSTDPPLVAVADGMGAGRGSATAGSTAMATLVAAVQEAPPPAPPAAGVPALPGDPEATPAIGVQTLLREAVARVQREVRAAGSQLTELTGCTLTALLVDGAEAWIAHLGDSRVYRWRDGLLELLTCDHTMAWLGVLHGWYPADSPEAARARYHLTRYVGHPAKPEPDLLCLAPRPGDGFLICTDGIADQVPYQRLAAMLDPAVSPDVAVATLLADARTAGGRDNATAALIRVQR